MGEQAQAMMSKARLSLAVVCGCALIGIALKWLCCHLFNLSLASWRAELLDLRYQVIGCNESGCSESPVKGGHRSWSM